ncbi:L-rhamnose mutarotase [Flavobacterium pectinovorum]|jgi:L-rhamnose mutarotase|uniref:L-rhamnose mutarotase n=1 Tax=Flavobacterium pectinovorum TaxID=29533 RepID=A0A502EEP5_9FLAO|nr:L-rhamnose mutarotase [Flavobacterium pectinovorum]TPG36185.1 L-rhamnose mutarotase [Flavobacterium pectinovorum]
MITQKYCLALDLNEDSSLITEYKKYHEKIWPEITESIVNSGIENLDIYCVGNRLFMIIEANETFTFEKKEKNDANNPVVQKWEELMWKYQKALPWAKEGEKWMLMEKIFDVHENR